jgi:4-hydroxy-tetrahydrodipicolinate synthase
LSHDEHHRVVKTRIEAAKGRVPVVAGAGSNNTDEAVSLAQHAEKAGADAVLVVTPYYNKPTQRGLYLHFATVAKATKLPIIIYNIPPRSVIDMMPETMGRLANDFKNIVGVKDATGKVERVSEQRMTCGKDFIQLGRRRFGARLQRPWRCRLHLGDVERRAASVLGIPGRRPCLATRRRRWNCRIA